MGADPAEYAIGIDIGGTFTDGVLVDEDGRTLYAKTPTSEDIHSGVIECLDLLAQQLDRPTFLERTRLFAHGTTISVNALVQLKGVKTGLITTHGFKHHLYMMRATRAAGLPEAEAVDMNRIVRPPAIVPLDLTEEVVERIDYKGDIVCSLDQVGAERAVDRLIAKGVEAIAVSLLWSFKNPIHEQKLKELIGTRRPDLFVSLSSEVAPIMGEYERTATTTINAYLGPVLKRYVDNLQGALSSKGLRSTPLMMQSHGGVIPISRAPERAVSTLASGLAGGVIGARYLGEVLGCSNIITTDMGGTTFEVGVIVDGSPLTTAYAYSPRFGPYVTRYVLQVPTIDLTAIGSGGGSIAWVDESGMVKVGPRSAAANPGPACYGRGGSEPTVTDADLVLGYLNPDFFLGGRMKLDLAAARRALRDIAERLGMDVLEVARGIFQVTNHQAADLIRNATIERGYDPRDFTLFVYGGAGPLHCTGYARELGARIIIPSLATVHSAFGVVVSDLQQSFAVSDYIRLPGDARRFNQIYRTLGDRALQGAAEWTLPPGAVTLIRSLGLRFRAQTHELQVPVPPGELTPPDLESVVKKFLILYEIRYGKGTAFIDAGIEATTFRVDIVGRTQKPVLRKAENAGPDPGPAKKGERDVFLEEAGGLVRTPLYDGHRLRAGNCVMGPAVIEMTGNTMVLSSNQSVSVDPYLNFEMVV